MNTPLLVAMVILVICSAFFSSAETAFSSVNKIKLKAMMTSGKKDKKIEKALNLADDYDTVLSTVLIGNNLVNIACTSIATLFFTGILGDNSDLGATVSTIVMTIIVLVFGEVTPKTIANEKAENWVIKISPIIKVLIIIFYPLNIFFKGWKALLSKLFGLGKEDVITEEELKTYVEESHADGVLNQNESELIRSSIEFDDIEVEDILVPRVDVEAVEKGDSLEEIEEVFNTTNYSRLPVYEETIDNIIGVIHERDFSTIKKRKLKSIRTIIKPVPMVAPNTKISKVLRIFQENKTHLAVIIDEFGGTQGIVTLEDILEELVGEIWDEHDEVEVDFKEVNDDEFIVLGSAPIDDFYEFFDIEEKEEDDDISTVNGWVVKHIDKIPEVGDAFVDGKLSVLVLSLDGNRAEEIKITVENEEDVSKEEAI